MTKFYSDVVLVPLGLLAHRDRAWRARSTRSSTRSSAGSPTARARAGVGGGRGSRSARRSLRRRSSALFTPPTGARRRAARRSGSASTFMLYFVFHTIYAHAALRARAGADARLPRALDACSAMREGFAILGTIVASVAPLGLLTRVARPTSGARSRSWRRLRRSLLVALYSAARASRVRERPDFVERESNPLVPGVRRALRNRPFRILLADATWWRASPARSRARCMPYFNDYVIRPDEPGRAGSAIFLGRVLRLRASCSCRSGCRRRGASASSRRWLASFVMGITGGAGMFFLGAGRHDGRARADRLGRARRFGAGLFLGAGDPGRRDRLRRAPHRQASRGAVRRVLGDAAEVRRDPERGDPDRGARRRSATSRTSSRRRRSCSRSRRSSRSRRRCSRRSRSSSRGASRSTRRVHRAILAGIDAHRRGESAIDPLTGQHRSRRTRSRDVRRGHRLVPRLLLAGRAAARPRERSRRRRAWGAACRGPVSRRRGALCRLRLAADERSREPAGSAFGDRGGHRRRRALGRRLPSAPLRRRARAGAEPDPRRGPEAAPRDERRRRRRGLSRAVGSLRQPRLESSGRSAAMVRIDCSTASVPLRNTSPPSPAPKARVRSSPGSAWASRSPRPSSGRTVQ